MIDDSSTRATAAYSRVRADIIAGVIAPGSKILIRSVCERLGIGLSPMREALNRLASEGLVHQFERRGFAAAPLNLVDLADLTLARSELNAAALRDAIASGDDAWEEAVVLAHHRLERSQRVQGIASPEWEACHRNFHSALLEACRSARLKLYCEQLFDGADRYRLASRATSAAPRDVDQEHQEIMRAVLGRDPEAAIALLHAHVEQTAELVRQVLRDAAAPRAQ